ncbi:heme/hemin ABC transporter substrate-binding protein [Corynebacterium urogenitale]
MPTLTPGKRTTAASISLAAALALVLSSCGAPISGSPVDNSSQESTETAGESRGSDGGSQQGNVSQSAHTGPVSAELPPHDPEVLVDDVAVRASDAHNKRILTLDRAGALSRMVWTLGLGENLVGRDTASDFPGVSHLPQVTPGGHSINAETVLALRPDIVFTDGTIGPSRVIEKLRDAGVKVVSVSEERTPETIGTLVDEMAAALGLQEQAKGVKDRIEEQLREATDDAQSRADGRKMMILYLRGSGVAMIAGPDSGGRRLIKRLGGVDASEKLGITGAFTPLTPEALSAAAPETIIVMRGGLESVGGVDGLLEVPGVAHTPAGKSRSVLDVPDSQLLSFGTDTPRTITAMAEALYG